MPYPYPIREITGAVDAPHTMKIIQAIVQSAQAGGASVPVR